MASCFPGWGCVFLAHGQRTIRTRPRHEMSVDARGDERQWGPGPLPAYSVITGVSHDSRLLAAPSMSRHSWRGAPIWHLPCYVWQEDRLGRSRALPLAGEGTRDDEARKETAHAGQHGPAPTPRSAPSVRQPRAPAPRRPSTPRERTATYAAALIARAQARCACW